MIRGELTNLRAVERTDAGTLHRWLNDPDVMRYQGVPDSTVSLAEVQRRIEGWLDDEARLGRPSCLMIELLDGSPVGFALLTKYEEQHRALELAMVIAEPGRCGQGLGTDALTALVDTAFDQWNLHRLDARPLAFHERAHRMYARCGFRHDATLREAAYLDGRYHDVHLYCLLASDRPHASESSS